VADGDEDFGQLEGAAEGEYCNDAMRGCHCSFRDRRVNPSAT
jgi:hypothetical protein